jgi:hypothetical protein
VEFSPFRAADGFSSGFDATAVRFRRLHLIADAPVVEQLGIPSFTDKNYQYRNWKDYYNCHKKQTRKG